MIGKNFSDISPMTYAISRQKEIAKRRVKDFFGRNSFAKNIASQRLSNIVSSHSSGMIKVGRGIDPALQVNKVHNIKLAAAQIDGLIIAPGEVFSFWQRVGDPSCSRGFRDGRVITQGQLTSGTGGGLCNLANTINLLVLNSPLTITELHTHSDALSPDSDIRVPFGAGTSVSYNYIDYRFCNDTDQVFQLSVCFEDNVLRGELRSQHEIAYTYRIIEEDHHFKMIGSNFYRFSKVYKQTTDKVLSEIVDKELIWDNKSLVMFDHDLIPHELIR